MKPRVLLACAALTIPGFARAETSEADRAARLSALTLRLERAEAVKAVERLQYAYGYYQDRFLFDQIPTLFVDKGAEVRWEGGVWLGQAGARRLWVGHFGKTLAGGAKGPVAGRLWDMPQWQGVVTVAPDGLSARGRFRSLGKLVIYRQKELWISGVYEDEFVRESGVWKISKMRYCSPWQAVYTEGWQDAKAADFAPKWRVAPKDPDGPDRLETAAERCPDQWPGAGVMPFSFVNPVTGNAAAIPAGASQ